MPARSIACLTITRTQVSSDANIQKAIRARSITASCAPHLLTHGSLLMRSQWPRPQGLGMVTDSWGALSLAYTMANFGVTCYTSVPASHDGLAITKAMGPGWWCYIVCLLFAILRATMHWLTPVPGLGAGCCTWQAPSELALAMERSSSENASEPDHSEVTFTGQSLLTAAAAQECKVEELQIISLHGSQEVQDSELIELSGLCELAAVDLSDTSVTGAMQA